MSETVNQVTHVLLCAAVLAFFISLRRTGQSARYKLWTIGWAVMLLHFAVEFIPDGLPIISEIAQGISYATLALTAISFLLSVSVFLESPLYRRLVFIGVGVPATTFSMLMSFGVTGWPIISLAVWTYVFSVIVFISWHRRFNTYVTTMAATILLCGAASVYVAYKSPETSFHILLLALFVLCGVALIRTYRRATPGVIGTLIGFGSWSMVWLAAILFPHATYRLGANSELWNLPKIIIALGMIVTELEDRSMEASQAVAHAHQLTSQMVRFADLTSRLLGGIEVRSFCSEIARTIVEVGNFRRAAILLLDDTGRLTIGGHAGLTADVQMQLHEAVSRTKVEDIERACSLGRQIRRNCYICPPAAMADLPNVPSTLIYRDNTRWNTGDELLIPLRSASGSIVGCISLDDPHDPDLVTAEELAAIDVLGTDLGIAIEKSVMQRKMAMHDKLASIGQLVGGVAHELNNPLTVVLGYSELMADGDADGRFTREITTLRREAQRMRSIIDNLLRFARQAKTETKSANVGSAVDDALALRQYDLQRKNIAVERDLSPDLPAVNFDESQLKTVLVNLLSNSMDAMENSDTKHLGIFARRVMNRVLISVIDSGTGFADLARAFDPFFSTKGLGRGPGLGLSMCYGIVKQHGGDIYAQNVAPHGACVTLELSVFTDTEKPRASAASASVSK